MEISLASLKRRILAVLLCGAMSLAAPAAALGQELTSPRLVKELASAMTAAKLDAIAVQDTEAPDRFVAAMLFPGVQLLMVSARHSSPDYLEWQIEQKQYKDVYSLLQQGGLTESRVFFQDLGADGLPDSGQDSVDVMYERGVQTLFDVNADNGDSREEYRRKLQEADAQYARLLQLAIEAARAAQAGAPGEP